MSTRRAADRTPPARARARRAARRRAAAPPALGALVGAALLVALAIVLRGRSSTTRCSEITLPLRHEDIIRQQARDKGLDPALIAGVIYAESQFRDGQTSPPAREGLMQITPDTARYIAHKSGGTQFERRATSPRRRSTSPTAPTTCATCCDRYGGNETLALAAYNGGEGNVDRWIAAARAGARSARPSTTSRSPRRAPTSARVEQARDSTARYAAELGLG